MTEKEKYIPLSERQEDKKKLVQELLAYIDKEPQHYKSMDDIYRGLGFRFGSDEEVYQVVHELAELGLITEEPNKEPEFRRPIWWSNNRYK